MSCSASSSNVRAALRTALRVQQRRPVYSWVTRISASATTATTSRVAAASMCTQLHSMSTTSTNQISGGSSSSSASSPPASTLSRALPAENQPQREHEQQHKPSDASVQSTSPSSPSSLSSSPSRRSRYLLTEMTIDDLEQIPNSSIHIFQDLVQQLEEDWSIVTTRDDVSLVVRPLLDTCLRMMPREAAADLAERILFACLARLPPSVTDRYHPNNHHPTSSPPPLSAIGESDKTSSITTSSSTNRTTSYPYPDADVYVKVMLACGHLRTLAAAERVHCLFRLMMSEYRAEVQYLATTATTTRPPQGSSSTKQMVVVPQAPAPNMKTFKTLMRSYAASGTLQGTLQAHEILNVMENLSGSSSRLASPRAPDAASRGRSNLDILGDGASTSSNAISGTTTSMVEGVSLRLDIPPDLACYNAVLNAYAKCLSVQDHHHDHPFLLERVRLLWQRMNDLQQEQWLKYKRSKNNVDYFQLDWFSYYPMLRIYHNHVLALLQQEPRNAQGPSHQPLRRSSFSNMDDDGYNSHAMIEHDTLLQEIRSLVVALAQTTTIPATVPRCYRLLSRQLDDTQHEGHHPITWAYQVLVQALVTPQQQGNYAHDKNLQELERIQQAHAIVMALAGQRVDGLDTTLCPVYTNDDDAEDDIIWPSHDVILDVIQAWERLALKLTKSSPGGHVATAPAAAVIPERIQQLLKVAVKAPFKSLQDFHQAIDYWGTKSQWKNAPFVNQAILERLLREKQYDSEIGVLIPTSQTFAMVMWSWMESQSPHAPRKIEWLFDQLISLYERSHSDIHMMPNGTHVHLLLSSWIRHCPSGARFDGKSGMQLLAAQHVTRLLQSLGGPTSGSREHAWKNRLLHARHFDIALKAWARQRIHRESDRANGHHPDQAQEMFTLWKHLVDRANSVPPLVCFNIVLQACVNASVDAQKISLSGDEGDDDKREKKRRQDHYNIAMSVYHHMRDHEVKNKGKPDQQRVKRDTFSYILILQAWKQTLIALPNQVIYDPIQFLQEIMEDSCAEGLLTQTLCFEIVEFLILFVKDDSLAKKTLGRLFGVSESTALAVLKAAPLNLIRETKASKLRWQGPNKPSEILLENLPRAWARNTSFGKAWQESKSGRHGR